MSSIRAIILSSSLGLLLSILSPTWGGEGGLRLPIQTEPLSLIQLVAKRSNESMVRNIRTHEHKTYTRIVLDIDRDVHPAPSDHYRNQSFQLTLPHTRILKRALSKTTGKNFPIKMHVSRTKQGALVLRMPTQSWKKYKWYILQNPTRLVLDLYPSSTRTPSAVQAPDSTPKQPTTPQVKQKTPVPPPVTAPAQAKTKKTKMLIVLDPGHGGKDPGALGGNGTKEKDIVLNISRHLRDLLAKQAHATVLMTREKDEFIELEDRATFANKHKADLFVSIHINSNTKKSIKGLEMYHFGEASDPRALEVSARENGTPLQDNGPAWQFILADKLQDKKIEDSQEFAWTTKKALVNYLRPFYKVKDHGVKTAPFFVLRMTTMPAILAEIAFISNPTEEKLLKSSKYQKRVAQGIFEGIKSYLEPLQTASR